MDRHTYVRIDWESFKSVRAGSLRGPLPVCPIGSKDSPFFGFIVCRGAARHDPPSGFVVFETNDAVFSLSHQSLALQVFRDHGELLMRGFYVIKVLLCGSSAAGVICHGTASIPLSELLVAGAVVSHIPCSSTEMHYDVDIEGDRFSRTTGALPGGKDSFHRMMGLRCAVVGAGRGGSYLGVSVVQSYPIGRLKGANIWVVDPKDFLAPHSLNAHRSNEIGQSKASAVVNLMKSYGAVGAKAVHATAERSSGILAHASVIFSWPDVASARGFLGILASAFGIVLIDVGTRVDDSGDGAVDARCIIPGGGCFFCAGGAREGSTRAGSLLSINLLGVSQAMLLFEDFISGGLLSGGSQWRQIDVRRGAVMQERRRSFLASRSCPVCQEAFGGTAAFYRLTRWIENMEVSDG